MTYRTKFPVAAEPFLADEEYALAVYNNEVGRGVAHTPEYDARMAEAQARWNEKQRADAIARGCVPHEGGGWICPPPKRRRWWRR
jgi:hypothetical protein